MSACCRDAGTGSGAQDSHGSDGTAVSSGIAGDCTGSGPVLQAAGAEAEVSDVAARLRAHIAAHDQFELLPSASDDPRTSTTSATAGTIHSAVCSATGDSSGSTSTIARSGATAGSNSVFVEFSVRSVPLYGVDGGEVNAAVLRRVNASGAAFACGRAAPALLSSLTGAFRADRVAAIQLALAAGTSVDQVDAMWAAVAETAAPELRRAFAHVHGCKCDLVGLAVAAAPAAGQR